MALTRYKLGDLIEQRREKYDGSNLPVRGVTRDGFISPKQDVDDLHLYNMFYMNDFVFNPARMEINSIALNLYFDKAACSSLYEVFHVIRTDIVDPRYLNLFIKRDEFARLCSFIGWGSAREYCRVADISDIEIDLPPIEIQRKYVAIYEAMCEKQRCYEAGLEDLKLACEAGMEKAMRLSPREYLRDHVDLVEDLNDGSYDFNDVRGVNNKKELISTKADISSRDLSKFQMVQPGTFFFNHRTSRNGSKISITYNYENAPVIVTEDYVLFSIRNNEKLEPGWLYLFVCRDEFDRYAIMNSWGSSTEFFNWEDMQDVRIPIPPIEIQRSIADLFTAYNQRKEINEKLKAQIKDLCPILIKGSLEEANKA